MSAWRMALAIFVDFPTHKITSDLRVQESSQAVHRRNSGRRQSLLLGWASGKIPAPRPSGQPETLRQAAGRVGAATKMCSMPAASHATARLTRNCSQARVNPQCLPCLPLRGGPRQPTPQETGTRQTRQDRQTDRQTDRRTDGQTNKTDRRQRRRDDDEGPQPPKEAHSE